MKKIFLTVIGIVLLNGCSAFVLQNPTINDLNGEWEASGPMPYAKLIITPDADNLLIVVQDQKTVEMYKLDSFKSAENGFEIDIIKLNEKAEPEKMNGAIVLNRLVLSPVNKEGIKIWFIKSNELNEYQDIARQFIKKHNQQRQLTPALSPLHD